MQPSTITHVYLKALGPNQSINLRAIHCTQLDSSHYSMSTGLTHPRLNAPMDGSKGMGIPRQRWLENITVLRILNEIPDVPRKNLLPSHSDSTRQLTIDRERDLADCFAFLSARTDDMQKVMAVYVEEDLDHTGLTIRMAVNTGPFTNMKRGLRNIAILFKTASLRN
jgi:hypothetical protein